MYSPPILDAGSHLCYAFPPVNSVFIALMQQTAPAPGGGSSGFMNLVPLLLIFGVFYLLILRPQAKKAKLHQQMLSQLKKGDDVVTSGGVLGRITGIKEDEVTLQVQEGVRLRVLRSAVSGRQPAAGEAAKADAKAPASS
jgi:preprotein translocase subunit YajC